MKCCIITPVIRGIQLYWLTICFSILIKRCFNSLNSHTICITSIFPHFLYININSTWIIMNVRKRNHIVYTIPYRILTLISLWHILCKLPIILVILLDIRKRHPVVFFRQRIRLDFTRRLMCRLDRDQRWPDLGCIVMIIPDLL